MLIGTLLAIASALSWGSSVVSAARASRRIGGLSTILWVYALGIALIGPIALAHGLPHVSRAVWLWTLVTVLCALGGLASVYAGIGYGKVGLVAAISSMQGAVAVVYSLIGGASLAAVGFAGVAITMAGMFAATLAPDHDDGSIEDRRPGRAIAFGLVASLLQGGALYASVRAADVGADWTIFLTRVAAVAAAIPLIAAGRLRSPRPALGFVLFCAVAEICGFAAYILAADRIGIPVAAVIASQFAAVAAVIGYLALGERLSRRQVAGIVTIIAGVTLLTLTSGS